MLPFSQNQKLGVTIVGIFTVSLSLMAFFFAIYDQGANNNPYYVNVLTSHGSANHGSSDAHAEGDELAHNPYSDYFSDEDSGFVVDTEGQFLYATDTFCQLVGTDCHEISNQNIFDLVRDKDLGRLARYHSKLVHDQQAMPGVGPFRINTEHEVKLVIFDIEHHSGSSGQAELVFKVRDITQTIIELQEEDDQESEGKNQIYATIAKVQDIF